MSASRLNDVFLVASELSTLRTLIANDEQAHRLARTCILDPAKQAVAQPIIVPKPTESFTPKRFDLSTGAAFAYDRNQPREHRSVDGEPLRGPDYDAAWASTTHDRNANEARQCALAGALFDDAAASNHAKTLLMRYADEYLSHVPGGKQTCTWGRVHCSGLEEAVWVISMLWSAELLDKQQLLSGDDLNMLRIGLFEPAVDLLWGEWYCIHNIRMWHNAAIGCIGLAFGDRLAIREAIYGQKGFRQQLVDGFRADGLLYEGSPGYHAYAVTAKLFLAEAMARNGFEPYREPHLKRILLAPWLLMQPDGTTPAMNDYCPTPTLPTRLYGTALHRYDDPQIDAVAKVAFDQWQQDDFGPNRTAADWNRTPAYFGRQEIDWLLAWDKLERMQRATRRPAPIVDMRASGLGILRQSDDDFLLLKASALGSGHDHHDKLHLIWWRDGIQWLGDTGTTTNQSHLHEDWFKHTLSHNTVTVDQTKQERCDATLTEVTSNRLRADAQPYPNVMRDVKISRAVSLSEDGAMHDRLEVHSDVERVCDYAVHPHGELLRSDHYALKPAQLDVDEPGYRVMRDVYRAEFAVANDRALVWQQGDQQLRIDLSQVDPGAEIYIAKAPITSLDFTKMSEMLLIRCIGSDVQIDIYYSVESKSSAVDSRSRLAPIAAPA